ncbi:MAG TPA: YjbH domain-containing protein [Rhizomicrobium sp.]|nr:YjbH domain-containing protein [Rhizomicrobium sp.]
MKGWNVKERVRLPGRSKSAARCACWKTVWKTMAVGTAALAVLGLGDPLAAQELEASTNLFGGRGLIGTPSARMAPDGALSVGASFLKNTQHYNLGFQALPWLEATFRYSGLQHFQPDYPVYYDRAFGLKARLWDETAIFPAVAVGIDDIIGTGVYNGEYLVASKQFGNVDASIGLGWGRHAGTQLLRNPVGLIFPSFNNRRSFFGQAGGADFKAFFHGGKIGLFGGVEWHSPIRGLSLLVEYDSDTYAQEKTFGTFSPRSQINYGLTYALSDQTKLGLSWLYGTSLGGSFSLQLDPVHSQYPQKIEPPPPPVTVRSDAERQQALALLLERRDPGAMARAQIFQARNADRSNFVDALWRQGDDLADVQVRRGVLELTVTGTISGNRCNAVAKLMRGVAAHISRISLHDRAGFRSVSCAVPRTVEAAPMRAAFLSSNRLVNLTTPAVEVVTIDATAVAAKSDWAQVDRAIRAALKEQQIFVEALSRSESGLLLYYRNYHYQLEADALDRITRVLTEEAPSEIERFRLIAVNKGVPTQEFDVLRGPVERSFQQEDGNILAYGMTITPPAMDQPVLAQAARDNYPRFTWGLYPQFRQALFDPNQPFGVQFLAVLGAGVELAPGLSITGTGDINLYSNFLTNRPSDSQLPHVRSDFAKYFTQGKTGISSLETSYEFRLAPTLFVKGRIGYLESMFAGVGGEILWRPEGARWALGADIYKVWQRDFDRLFGLQRYRATTGHVSLYYDSPWYGLNFQLRAGQYLAGDRGATLQITRRFSTGIEIGAFVTKTNVSAAQFGEGSFDKGIIIRIPLGWIAPIESQSVVAVDLRPVQRDGGQVLAGDATLYAETRNTSESEIIQQVQQLALH